MYSFSMNGYVWRVEAVDRADPMLVDRTGRRTSATTDPMQRVIFVSNRLYGDKLATVLVHEMGHCALFSFHLVNDIHRMVKEEYWVEMEEWVCNLIADYGAVIFEAARGYLGQSAWRAVPHQLEKFIA